MVAGAYMRPVQRLHLLISGCGLLQCLASGAFAPMRASRPGKRFVTNRVLGLMAVASDFHIVQFSQADLLMLLVTVLARAIVYSSCAGDLALNFSLLTNRRRFFCLLNSIRDAVGASDVHKFQSVIRSLHRYGAAFCL